MESRPYCNKAVRHKLKNSVYLKAAMTQSKRNLKLERDLTETRDRLHSLIDTVPGGIAIFRIAKTVQTIFFNDAACALMGFTRAEYNMMVKDDIMALVYEEDRKILSEEIENAVTFNRHIDCVYRVNHKSGHHPWVHLFAVKYKQEDGVPIFHGVFLDITREIEDRKEIEAANQKLIYRADYDVLTGIYNRQAFCRETAKMLVSEKYKRYVLLRIDVEKFKVINDLFGTETGDEVLCTIALNLKKSLKRLGTYGRLEADHFVCCFPEKIFNVEKILEIIDKVINGIKINYSIVVNFGVYPIDDSSLPVERMCDRANLALRTIKGNYLKKYAFYDENLRNTILKEQQIENEMDQALNNGQFKIHLQPIYSVASEKPVSAEALVRWYHPQRGLISPADFIPLFERNGFISKLDAYVWEEVCKFINEEKSKGDAVVPISVNVSRINLYNANICNYIISLIQKYNIEPEMLKLEITESAYTDNPHQLLKAMETLQNYGFEVLMDDFGSGYSSLNMLKDVPVDILKIDMKFIEDLEVSSRAGSVMANVIRMAKWLNMSVVAEGVETKAQLVVLRNIGCDKVQGYYLSKPLPTEEFKKLMSGEVAEKIEKPLQMNEADISFIWEADQKFASFINGMIDGMGIYEIVGKGLEIVRVNDGYFDIMGGTAKDLFGKKNNILDHVYPDDRDKLMSSCSIAIQKKSVQGLHIRRIHENGSIIWLDLRISYIGKLGDNDSFYLGINNISNQKKLENSKEIFENILRDAPLGIGIFEIKEKVIPLYLSDEGCELLGFSPEEYSEPSNRQFMDFDFIRTVLPMNVEFIAEKESFKKTTKVYKKDKTLVSIDITGKYKKDVEGHILVYAYFWDTEKLVETKKQLSKTEHIDLQQGVSSAPKKRKILIVDDNPVMRGKLKNILEDTYNILEAENSRCALKLLDEEKIFVEAVLLDIVSPAIDGYSLLNLIRLDETLCEIPVIAITGEDDKDAETKAISLGVTDFLAKPFKPAVIKHRIASHIKLKETTTSKNEVEKIINNLPGGVCIFEISDKIRTRYVGEGISNICGYSVDEYLSKFGEDVTQIVFHEDVEHVTKSIYKCKSANQPIDVEYHVNCKNGDIGYSRIQANFAYDDGDAAVYYGVITDLTAKELELRQRYERERAFIRSLTGDSRVFFECDLVTGKIIPVGEKTSNLINSHGKITNINVLEVAIDNIIHSEDKELFDGIRNVDKVIENILNGKNETYLEYRYSSLLGNFEGYRWANAMISFILNPKTKHPHLFACIRDINEQKLKDLDMMEKAQKDFLTGLFNRAAFQELAQKSIDESKENSGVSAFLIIDIDNFKKINDTYGHVYGDVVLKHTAERLGTVFRSNDILGRLGGDEMTVFMTNIPSADIAVKKGFEICRVLGSWRKDDEKIPLTCSVGVAIMPEHGHTLEKLYHNADMALYQAKHLGKNMCCLFDEKITAPNIPTC
ncbi:MAG: EAL domain-containing protein [Lachnospiraceae bacterium]|nr:EAL domain-containing protein [Lachnospiraceae bacterium]